MFEVFDDHFTKQVLSIAKIPRKTLEKEASVHLHVQSE